MIGLGCSARPVLPAYPNAPELQLCLGHTKYR
jgi:hypothetical protein